MSVLERLKVLFPGVAEDFLIGFCEGYSDDELVIEHLVDVILSFEHLPQKEDFRGNVYQREEACALPQPDFLETDDDLYQEELVAMSFICDDPVVIDEVLRQSAPIEISRPVLAEKGCVKIKTSKVSTDNDDNGTLDFHYKFPKTDGDKSTLLNNTDYELDSQGLSVESSLQFFFEENESYSQRSEIPLEMPATDNTNTKALDTPNVNLSKNTAAVDSSEEIELPNENDELESVFSLKEIFCENEDFVTFNETKPSQSISLYTNNKTEGIDPLISDKSCRLKRPIVRLRKKTSVRVYEQRLRKRLLRQCRMPLKNKTAKTSLNDSSQFATVDRKFSLLTKILPDADGEFLKAQCLNLSNQDDLLMFISRSLENRDYPKAKESEAAKVMGIFECTVDDFLQAIPDPTAEFSSNNYNRIGYEENAEIYLKSRYQELSPEVLKTVCIQLQYNLTKVCQEVEEEGHQPGPYCLEYISLHHAPSVFFRQEVWYIEHKAEIQNLLDSVIEAAKVEEEFNRPPTPAPVEEVFECEICSEEIEDYTQLGTCDGAAGHLFCKTCIKRNIDIQFGRGATTFSCLQKCEGCIPFQIIEEVLPAKMIAILKEKIQEAEVRAANIPGLETCPFCPYAYGPGEENTFTCLNSSCKKISCRICRKEDHSPEICEMFKSEDEETARHFVENKMTEALVRPCYNCGVEIVKEDGCNMMTCSFNECRAMMCYICRQPVVDYNHFNGQGGDNFDRCELFSDDTFLHDNPVAVSAQQAFNALVANNPGINLDPNRVIPK